MSPHLGEKPESPPLRTSAAAAARLSAMTKGETEQDPPSSPRANNVRPGAGEPRRAGWNTIQTARSLPPRSRRARCLAGMTNGKLEQDPLSSPRANNVRPGAGEPRSAGRDIAQTARSMPPRSRRARCLAEMMKTASTFVRLVEATIRVSCLPRIAATERYRSSAFRKSTMTRTFRGRNALLG